MKNSSLIFTAAVISGLAVQSVFAGTATLSGSGEAKAAAEFVTVRVSVTSECYPSARVASTTNDGISSRVLELLKSYADTNKLDEVTATGGYVERYTGYRPNTGQPVCVQQFKKQNLLTLKTHAVADFAENFAELQDELYAMGMSMPADAIDKPTNFLEIAAPMPGLSPATTNLLERKALVDALRDAKEKFQVTLALAGVSSYKIISYSEAGLNPMPIEAVRRGSSPDFLAPVQFGQLKVSKLLNVQFQFEGGEANLDLR